MSTEITSSGGNDVAATPYGLLAQFDTVESLVRAAERVRDEGYTKWDSYAPFAVHGLDEAMGLDRTSLPVIVFLSGLAGCIFGLVLQWWTNGVNYPFVISGKPLFGLPVAIPITFEMTILFAAIGSLLGMLGLNGLPRLHHPLFKSERFRRATTDKFFIAIEASDPIFDAQKTRRLLEEVGSVVVEEVEE